MQAIPGPARGRGRYGSNNARQGREACDLSRSPLPSSRYRFQARVPSQGREAGGRLQGDHYKGCCNSVARVLSCRCVEMVLLQDTCPVRNLKHETLANGSIKHLSCKVCLAVALFSREDPHLTPLWGMTEVVGCRNVLQRTRV